MFQKKNSDTSIYKEIQKEKKNQKLSLKAHIQWLWCLCIAVISSENQKCDSSSGDWEWQDVQDVIRLCQQSVDNYIGRCIAWTPLCTDTCIFESSVGTKPLPLIYSTEVWGKGDMVTWVICYHILHTLSSAYLVYGTPTVFAWMPDPGSVCVVVGGGFAGISWHGWSPLVSLDGMVIINQNIYSEW